MTDNSAPSHTGISIRVLGDLAVFHDGQPVPLPSSRKARALLAYLAISARPVRRERLCELFWERPNDPRAMLRWALSKLRQVVDTTDMTRLIADRERIALDSAEIRVDFKTLRSDLFDHAATVDLSTLQLEQMAQTLAEPLLAGLDTAGGEDFSMWLMAEREDARLMQAAVLSRLATHTDLSMMARNKWARRWLDLMPYDTQAASTLISVARRTGRTDEANEVERQFRETARQAMIKLPADFASMDDQKPTAQLDIKLRDSTPRWRLRSQSIGFCQAPDGVNIAYSTVGQGRPLVKAANWLNHLELDWDSPIWGPTFHACAQARRFIRYDERGNGLSDWTAQDLDMEAFVTDLETVVDKLGLEKFPLLGISQGCAVSVEYAARHPERVSGLVLISGYATGWRIGASQAEQERREAVMTLTRHGWGTANPAYRQIFSQTFMPDATPEQLDWFNEFQRQTTSPENAVRFQEAFGDIDVRGSLAKVQAPTIVFHAKGDQRISVDQGRALAIGIPGAEFVPLDSNNHILLGSEPAWQVCMDRMQTFLTQHGI